MTGFSPAWLALREAADARSRNRDVASTLSGHFMLREAVDVVDLGCGTGANLRATAHLLSRTQRWMLLDNDPAMLEAAAAALTAWSDEPAARDEKGRLIIRRAGQRIEVKLRQADLARDLQAALPEKVDLITASALFDLVSADFILKLARLAAARRAAFYAVLTYDGITRWAPRRPSDNAMSAAFHQHQLRDKGFGPAAGPTAPSELADQFRLHGYRVLEGSSPWRLSTADTLLLQELERGFAAAVAETGKVDAKTVADWQRIRHTDCEIGHTDTLALPGDTWATTEPDED